MRLICLCAHGLSSVGGGWVTVVWRYPEDDPPEPKEEEEEEEEEAVPA